ncbi:hypothetical protein EDD22DRAFT_845767 [Suillus occidentalis]|nr:hypothetical protein EDD22DRAFT_845767 [Suillus occidentalis]
MTIPFLTAMPAVAGPIGYAACQAEGTWLMALGLVFENAFFNRENELKWARSMYLLSSVHSLDSSAPLILTPDQLVIQVVFVLAALFGSHSELVTFAHRSIKRKPLS